ncbi:hypothetical protein [Deinococcus maricopensis]|uniref:Uncharacterized protein n=1 Tax=Deinococcus maricopensis (strain DSM 21211 / LMG 22137 / NRRL B-23946 / LB-34) TaxID=709986 RepID=E8U713_DEIML|nr:hypothetical protein [Deinococcus maricopensis]ADV66852.1 hypothetical protein Deima_1201 [Deinococcus maricopensis DSM 21211]
MTDHDARNDDAKTQDLIDPNGTGEEVDRARGGNGANTAVGDTSRGVLPDEDAVENQEEFRGSH